MVECAEGAIRELKKGVAQNMLQTTAPKCLWDDCAKLEALIRSHTSHGIYKLDGQVPETLVIGSTADISEIAEFKWYQWVYFCDTAVGFLEDEEILGRYLGPSTDIGPAMAAKMLKVYGQTVVRTTFRPLTDDEKQKDKTKQKKMRFDAKIERTLGAGFKPDDYKGDPDVETPMMPPYGDDKGNEPQMPDADDIDVDAYGQYVGADVNLAQGDSMANGRVVGRKQERDVSLKGRADSNPKKDTRTYNFLCSRMDPRSNTPLT
jgi:hypothetical protein